MATARVTITIDEEVLAELKGRVGPGEVSAFIVEALRHKLRIDPVMELLTQLDVMYGPLTPEEVEEGEKWYDEAMKRLSLTLEA